MKILYSDEPIIVENDSMFLAGPTPRLDSVRSWRPEALRMLEDKGFQGQVLVPERRDGNYDFVTQVEWETEALENCYLIVMWMPRDLVLLPGFTSNVESGLYLYDHRFVYGRPAKAPHTAYLDYHYKRAAEKEEGIIWRDEITETLEDLIDLALEMQYSFRGGCEANLDPPIK